MSKIDTGVITTYHYNGKVFEKYFVCNGKKNGEYLSFFDNGNISRKINYINDVLNGQYQAFWYGGNIWIDAYYNNGELYGNYKSFDTDGKLYSEFYNFIKDEPNKNSYYCKYFSKETNTLFVTKYDKIRNYYTYGYLNTDEQKTSINNSNGNNKKHLSNKITYINHRKYSFYKRPKCSKLYKVHPKKNYNLL